MHRFLRRAPLPKRRSKGGLQRDSTGRSSLHGRQCDGPSQRPSHVICCAAPPPPPVTSALHPHLTLDLRPSPHVVMVPCSLSVPFLLRGRSRIAWILHIHFGVCLPAPAARPRCRPTIQNYENGAVVPNNLSPKSVTHNTRPLSAAVEQGPRHMAACFSLPFAKLLLHMSHCRIWWSVCLDDQLPATSGISVQCPESEHSQRYGEFLANKINICTTLTHCFQLRPYEMHPWLRCA